MNQSFSTSSCDVVARHHFRRYLAMALVLFAGGLPVSICAANGIGYPGRDPGKAEASVSKDGIVLRSAALSVVWKLDDAKLGLAKITDEVSGATLDVNPATSFGVTLGDGRELTAADFRLVDTPTLKRLLSAPDSVRIAPRFEGWSVSASLKSVDDAIRITWEAVIRDASNYVQQRLTIHSEKADSTIGSVTPLRLRAAGAKQMGAVSGSPAAAGNWLFGCEHPLSENVAKDGLISCSLPCAMPPAPGEAWTVPSVIVVVPKGQLRRGFLYYVERERGAPYRPFFHYNGWCDVVFYGRKVDEKTCIERIHTIGRELAARGTPVDSFLFDEGWDDERSLWQFHKGFPEGLLPVSRVAAQYGGAVGVWISPFGGYGTAKSVRLKHGQQEGFETNSRGFMLSGKKYSKWFREVCLNMVKNHGVNHFKFDGVASELRPSGAKGEDAADIESLLRLLTDLRQLSPKLSMNVTVGSWPSPWWLWTSDSVWRGDLDYSFRGRGTKREQSINYSDQVAYGAVVTRAPLFPLNSVKYHAIFNARLGWAPEITGPEEGVIDDIRFSFGSGKGLLEFFVSPEKMTSRQWDALAETATWCRENADVLVDTHWIGQSPAHMQIYGFASWAPRKGIVVLRNPADAARDIELDAVKLFELPDGAPTAYRFHEKWKPDGSGRTFETRLKSPYSLQLAPLEIAVFEATPIGQD